MKFLTQKSDMKSLENDVKNKWRWEWLDERDKDRLKYGEWLRKPDTAGIAFCEACGRTINYKGNGKKAFKSHAEDVSHKKSIRAVKLNQKGHFFIYLAGKGGAMKVDTYHYES